MLADLDKDTLVKGDTPLPHKTSMELSAFGTDSEHILLQNQCYISGNRRI